MKKREIEKIQEAMSRFGSLREWGHALGLSHEWVRMAVQNGDPDVMCRIAAILVLCYQGLKEEANRQALDSARGKG